MIQTHPSPACDIPDAELWRRVLGEPGRTVLAVSHRRAVMAQADQVIVLKDGRVDDLGTSAELLVRNQEMRQLWRFEEVLEEVGDQEEAVP